MSNRDAVLLPGDIVREWSRWRPMIVQSVNKKNIHCQWFDGDKLRSGVFKISKLRFVSVNGNLRND
jgi:uncharacterized protein YodC (DUF2158 family)